MTEDVTPGSQVGLETVLDEVSAIVATMSWTRAQLEDVKAELLRWMSVAGDGLTPKPALIDQHEADDDPLDHAIIAEHERVADEPA
jgi:hypothetical protein